MQSLNEVVNLARCAKELKTHKERYDRAISNANTDKYQRRFNGDERFSVFSVRASFCCYTGQYGSSSCSTFGRVDSATAHDAFIRYLNANMEQIINWMADDIMRLAIEKTDNAERELEQQMEFIREVRGEIE